MEMFYHEGKQPVLNILDAQAVDEIKCLYGHHDLDKETSVCRRCGSVVDPNPILIDLGEPVDEEPDTYAVVNLRHGWWGLRNLRTDAVVTRIHGPGAREDITERWNAKTAVWLAWRNRQGYGEEG